MYLLKEDLYDVITDDPPDPINNEWSKKNKKAKAIINLLIEDDQIIHVKALETARQCWDALRTVHERTNLSSKLYLLRKLYSLKLQEGGNIIDHITMIYQTRDKLTAIGEEINNHHLSALLLCSLPPSYDTLITALEARTEDELTPDFIRSKLTDEYTKRIQNCDSSGNNTALKTFHQKFKGNQNKFCRYCRKDSHNIEDCWNLKNKNKTKTKNIQYSAHNKNVKFNDRSALCSQDSKFNAKLQNTKTNEKNFTFFVGNNSKDIWVIDSGSSAHICNDKSKFKDFCNDISTVTIANGQELKSLGYGSVKLDVEKSVTLSNVLFVPEIETNLISIKKATESGCKAIFENKICKIIYNDDICVEGKVNNNLYECKMKTNKFNAVNLVNNCTHKNCLDTWHKRLGHRNNDHIKQLVNKDMATGITLDKCTHDNVCETCIVSKLVENPYPKTAKFRATKPIELVHTDLCGPMTTPTVGGKFYFVTFIDDFSRFTVIYLLKNKHEVFSKIKDYVAMTANKFGRKVQAIRSDNGGEYIGMNVDEFLRNEGIDHQFSVPFSPPQNGVSERKNRSLMEMARCLLKDSGLPNSFWGEAVNTATYLQNRLPTSSCELTPYEMWTGRKPDLSNIKTFGCRAYAYINKTQRGKLDSTAREGIFVGYDNRSKGYRICTDGRKIIISRTVKFLENKNQEIIKDSTPQNKVENSNCEDLKPKLQLIDNDANDTGNVMKNQNSDGVQNIPRRSERSNRGVPPDRFAYIINDTRIIEPKCWDEIVNMQNPVEKEKWVSATLDEMNSLYENDTWELVETSPKTKVIGCKWAFKAKYNSQGQLEKYKARLVAKGFSQKYGIDYDETFAPVASHTTVRSFLAMALYKNLSLRHIDIKTAFLHGELQEEVYMHQPEGYVVPGEEHKVCRLKRAIYGLKQAARAWNLKIHDSLTNYGFQQSSVDKCLYKSTHNDITTYVVVYVDDLLVAGSNENINILINKLKKEYPVTDLGEAKYYLGINIDRPNKNTMTLDQKNKIHELIAKFGLENSKPTETPMEPGYVKITDEENYLTNNTKYRQAVGALLYISTVSRPDISAAVNILSRSNEQPREKDWEAVKRTIRYLKTTIDLKLTFTNFERPILGVYADADWANDPRDRKSISGNLFMLGCNPIYWSSKKQKCTALSSAEAEYVSAACAAQEVNFIVNLLNDLDLPQEKPITIYDDNQACIALAKSDKYHSKIKLVDLRYHMLREYVQNKIIKFEYLSTEMMPADIFTKALPRHRFEHIRDIIFNKKD